MLKQIVFALCVLSGVAFGDDLDGVCRLSSSGVQWSGVAISESHILTVAHHGLPVGQTVRAEFGVGRHGAFERVGVKARVLKSDKRKDLSLLSYELKSKLRVRHYPVGQAVRSKEKVRIAGYIGDEAMSLECLKSATEGTVDGIPVVSFVGQGVSGMSGSGGIQDGKTVVIQFGGDPRVIDAVSADTIREFLAE